MVVQLSIYKSFAFFTVFPIILTYNCSSFADLSDFRKEKRFFYKDSFGIRLFIYVLLFFRIY